MKPIRPAVWMPEDRPRPAWAIFISLTRPVIRNIIRENHLVNTYEMGLVDELANHRFSFQPGQFMMISMPHLGEAAISFSSSPDSWQRLCTDHP